MIFINKISTYYHQNIDYYILILINGNLILINGFFGVTNGGPGLGICLGGAGLGGICLGGICLGGAGLGGLCLGGRLSIGLYI